MKRFYPGAFRESFVRSIPILFSYVFISIAFGMLMAEKGFAWYVSLLVSLTVYTGAYQFVLVSFLAGGVSAGVVALTALLMNSRQAFYSLSFLEEFRRMGRRKCYMIATMTDETYAVNCSLSPDAPGRQDVMFFLAVLSRIYWLTGTVCGGLLGSFIPWDLTGIDFCMTALFVILLLDQWEKREARVPALFGAGISLLCLTLFGADRFMLPALLLTSAALLARDRKGATGQ